MNEIKIIYSTFDEKQNAVDVAQHLLKEQLIGCANIISPTTSLYSWEGKIQQEDEYIMLMKTLSSKVQATMNQIKKLHSYSCPCILVLPVENVNADYLLWMKSVVDIDNPSIKTEK